MTQEDRFIDVGGLRTRYRQAGAQGAPVLLLHGIGCSVLEWERNVAALAEGHRVFAVDLPGFGLTDKPPDAPGDIPGLARFVLAFLTALGIARAHLVGNSLGGRIALECAIAAPARVASLVLVSPAGIDRRGVLLEFRLSTIPGVGELFTRPSPFGLRLLWRKAFADPGPFVTDAMVATKAQLASLPGAQRAFLRTLRSFVGLGGFEPAQVARLQAALAEVRAPTLVIWGRDDRVVAPAHAEVLRRRMPDVRIDLWERCGHLPQIECAARFDKALPAFWAEVESAAT